MTDVRPIRREMLVAADPTAAFDVFTGLIGNWWPLAKFGVHGDGTVAFTEGALVETSADGATARWGDVIDWEPPHRLSFSWYPGADVSRASRVTVTFTAAGEQTLVTLQHDGWEVFDDPDAARAEYEHGWPTVLDRYQEAVAGERMTGRNEADGSADPEDQNTWIALIHRPADRSGATTIFSDARFAEHIAFLQRMHDRGYLVAAGPLRDEPGTGMTILKLPGADRCAEAARLATTDDNSVVGGLFTVDVRPWHVMFTA